MAASRSDARSDPSPYCSLYIARGQMEEIKRALEWHAAGKAKSHKAWKALRKVEEALRP